MGDREILEIHLNSVYKNTSETDIFPHGTKSLLTSVILDTLYRVSKEERTKLRESVPNVKLCRYNPKHLYPKLNGDGDNGQRKVWTACISA